MSMNALLLRPGKGAEYCDQPVCLSVSVCMCVCLSASISLEPLDRSARTFVCRSPAAVARSSSGGIALRYVLSVVRMTSRLAVMGTRPKRVGGNQRRRSITRATGAESDVYECLFCACVRLCLSDDSAGVTPRFQSRYEPQETGNLTLESMHFVHFSAAEVYPFIFSIMVAKLSV